METDHELSSLMPSGRPVSLTLSPFANRVVGELSWVIDYVRIQNPEKILLAATEGHVKAGQYSIYQALIYQTLIISQESS